MKFLTDIITDSTNVTYDAIKACAVATVLVALGLSIYSVVFDKHFDCQLFGFGMGAVFVAVGTALKLTTPAGITATSTTTVTETKP